MLPDLPEDRRITVLAGVESFYKREGGIWYKKVSYCNRCGKCCMNVPETWKYGVVSMVYDSKVILVCEHLKYEANEYLCDLGISRPYSCCIGDGKDMNISECNVEWEIL